MLTPGTLLAITDFHFIGSTNAPLAQIKFIAMNLAVRASLIKPHCDKVMPCELKSYDEYEIECRHSNA